MSGGHFNYMEHSIRDVAETIAEVIRDHEEYSFKDPKTLVEFKTGHDLLLLAYVYANRIDYLLSDDDGEETFHRRLRDDVGKIQPSLLNAGKKRRGIEMSMINGVVESLINHEYARAIRVHGELFETLDEGLAALKGEVDEVFSAARSGDMYGEHGVRDEVAQVAAVCVKLLDSLIKRNISEVRNDEGDINA
jgi:NTP pyrophosphatase (non-canonical NTP hydrolase)